MMFVVLAEWADGVEFRDATVAKEIGVVREEMRYRSGDALVKAIELLTLIHGPSPGTDALKNRFLERIVPKGSGSSIYLVRADGEYAKRLTNAYRDVLVGKFREAAINARLEELTSSGESRKGDPSR